MERVPDTAVDRHSVCCVGSGDHGRARGVSHGSHDACRFTLHCRRIFRIAASLVLKFPQWGWTLLNGVITTLLGVIIFRHFPETGLWLVGTLVGVDLLFNGISWIMLSLNIRSCRMPEGIADGQSERSSA